MRLAVGVLAASVVLLAANDCCAKPTKFANRRGLLEDITEFINLVPLEKIETVIKQWINKDPSVNAAFKFLDSGRYKEIIDQGSRVSEFKNYLDFLEKSRAPAHDLWNFYRLLIGLDPLKQLAKQTPPTLRTIDAAPLLQMVDECLEQIDKQQFEDLYNRKIEESEDFKYFVDRMDTKEHINVRNALRESAEFKEIVSELLSNGIDMYGVFKKIFRFFFPGGIPHSSLTLFP
ncbi:uncharacterized protein LOC135945722 [Cloeon dipterum]|uniref:uncharacterized protein LOC135945722 n=1 Tax=Cloeon dipterum TaxID=197152 RepID=UPI0032206024